MMPPIVSLAGMRSSDRSRRRDVGDAVRSACLDKGFLYVVDHGVPAPLIESVFAETRRFFALPEAEKAAVHMVRCRNRRGYEPMRGQTLEPGQPADLKEGFYLGNERSPDDPRVRAGLFNHGPNQWPAKLPGFRATMEGYYAQMEVLCRLTMRAVALALELAEDHFETFCEDAVSNLKLLHYPPQPPNASPGEKGCGAHTDWGAITYLLQDDAGGLQVWDAAAGWVDAPPMPGAYVLNLGDLMARWTNDRFRSTLHRVINVSGRERFSVPFFLTGRADHEVTCLVDEAPRYAGTTPLAHLQEMLEASFV